MKRNDRIDRVIRQALELKRVAERAAEEFDRYKHQRVVPLAKRHGVRDGDTWRLRGAKNQATVSLQLLAAITSKDRADRLPREEFQRLVRVVSEYRPMPALYELLHNGSARRKADILVRIFLEHGVVVSRSWALYFGASK